MPFNVNIFILLLFASLTALKGQQIVSHQFIPSRQFGTEDSIKLQVKIGTNSSLPYCDGFYKVNDTIIFNIMSCEGQLAFYGEHTVTCTAPPQATGIYKVVLQLNVVHAWLDASCKSVFKSYQKTDTIEVSGSYTSTRDQEMNGSGITVYISPEDHLKINFSRNIAITNYKIFDSLGKPVLTGGAIAGEGVCIASLIEGIYAIELVTHQGSLTKKFVRH
jgi:hypothetical protein